MHAYGCAEGGEERSCTSSSVITFRRKVVLIFKLSTFKEIPGIYVRINIYMQASQHSL